MGEKMAGTSVETLWQGFSEALQEAGAVIWNDPKVDSARLRAEGLRYLTRVVNLMSVVGMEIVDPAYPRFLRLFSTYRNLGNCNPDCNYLFARLSPEYTYRISGQRGSALMFEITTMDDDFLDYPSGKWLRTISEFQPETDGSIEIIMSAEPQPKNWVPLDATARWIYLRQYFYDWSHEIPADLTIERLGADYPPPPLAPERILERAGALAERIPKWIRGIATGLIARFYAGPPDELAFSGSVGGFQGISYGRGYFTCAPDEAVLLTFTPPANALYWSVQLGSHFWESLDWDVRQTSLNGFQAKLDPDGVFRGVIAQHDPGVPNWLDPAGHSKGLICCRVVRGEGTPEVTLRTVRLSELRAHLHPETPETSPQARREVLRQRALGAQRCHRE